MQSAVRRKKGMGGVGREREKENGRVKPGSVVCRSIAKVKLRVDRPRR